MDTIKQTKPTHESEDSNITSTQMSNYFGYPAGVSKSELVDSLSHEVIKEVPRDIKDSLSGSAELAIELEEVQQESQARLAAETARAINANAHLG